MAFLYLSGLYNSRIYQYYNLAIQFVVVMLFFLQHQLTGWTNIVNFICEIFLEDYMCDLGVLLWFSTGDGGSWYQVCVLRL